MTEWRHDDSAAAGGEIIPPVEAAPAAVEPPLHQPEPAAVTRVARRGAGAALWLVAALVLILLLVGASPYWAPALLPLLPWGEAAAAPQLGPLEARLTAAETAQHAANDRIARLEATLKDQAARPVASDTNSAAALASLGTRLDALEHRPDPAQAAAGDLAPLKDEIQRATARLDADEARIAAAPSPQLSGDRSLLIAIADLRAALAGSGPFAGELAAVTTLGQGDSDIASALAPLKDAAATGVPTPVLLLVRFNSEVAPAIRRADAAPVDEDSDFIDRVLARVRRLVTIRRLDDQGRPDDPVATAVAETRQALARGDLAAAVARLKTLSGAPAEAAAPFLASVEQRVAADATLGTLAQRVAGRIAGEASR